MSAFEPMADAGNLKKSDVVDNLTTNDATKALSAKQGKALQDSKVNVSDVVNDLTSTETDKPLSAAQGKALNDKIGTVPSGQTVEGQIDALNSNITTIELDGNSWLSSLDSGDCIFRGFRNGNIVTLFFRGESRSHAEDEVVAVIPASLRPAHYDPFFIGMSAGGCCVMRFNHANGNIEIYNNFNIPAGRLHFSFTYSI